MATQSTYVHQPRRKHEGERIAFSLPLSDSDRSYLKMHAVRQGKSPNMSDEALLALYEGDAVFPVATPPVPAVDAAASLAAAVQAWRMSKHERPSCAHLAALGRVHHRVTRRTP